SQGVDCCVEDVGSDVECATQDTKTYHAQCPVVVAQSGAVVACRGGVVDRGPCPGPVDTCGVAGRPVLDVGRSEQSLRMQGVATTSVSFQGPFLAEPSDGHANARGAEPDDLTGPAQRGDGEAVARPGRDQLEQESAGCQLTHLQHIPDKTFLLALYMRWLSLQDRRGLDAPEVTMGDVRVESEGSITTIWMDRPERRNA